MSKKSVPGDDQKTWRELVAAHAIGAADLLEDEALFLSLAPNKRDALLERLQVLDEYLEIRDPTVAKADEAAARMGVSRRTFYHLLGKLRAFGPVKGLAAGFRMNRRPSVARDGLDPVAEAALSAAFDRDPEMRASLAYREVVQACETAGVPVPKETEVRFRLHELRRERARLGASSCVGAALLIDQCYIDLVSRTHAGERRQVMVTLLVDRATKLILGYGISIEAQDVTALEAALFKAERKFLPAIAEAGFEFLGSPEELEFVVPPGFEMLSSDWEDIARNAYPAMKLIVSNAGPLRHGFALVRVLGDRLGVYKFRTRARPNDVKFDMMVEHSPGDCDKVIGYCVDAWNRPIIARMSGSRDAPAQDRTRPRTLMESVGKILEPFLDQIEDQFPNAAMIRKVRPRYAWTLEL